MAHSKTNRSTSTSPAQKGGRRARRSYSTPDGLDFTASMRQLCTGMINQLPELSHIDLSRVAICFAQTRKAVDHGLQATLTPMRFEQGSLTTTKRGRQYTVQRLYDRSGKEFLYILTFYLPRFQDQPFEEKLSTVVHELWHISPDFDGDLRRHEGRCYAHGPSQKEYDAHADRLAQKWLNLNPPAASYAFLQYNFRELNDLHGSVYGQKVAAPKLIPLAG